MTPESPVAVELCHTLLGWFIPLLDRMPVARRHTLAKLIESRLLGVLENLISASAATAKHEPCSARRGLEQQTGQAAFRQPQQELAREPQQQHGFSFGRSPPRGPVPLPERA